MFSELLEHYLEKLILWWERKKFYFDWNYFIIYFTLIHLIFLIFFSHTKSRIWEDMNGSLIWIFLVFYKLVSGWKLILWKIKLKVIFSEYLDWLKIFFKVNYIKFVNIYFEASSPIMFSFQSKLINNARKQTKIK